MFSKRIMDCKSFNWNKIEWHDLTTTLKMQITFEYKQTKSELNSIAIVNAFCINTCEICYLRVNDGYNFHSEKERATSTECSHFGLYITIKCKYGWFMLLCSNSNKVQFSFSHDN